MSYTKNTTNYLSTSQAARRLNVTSRTIIRWVYRGEFPNAKQKSAMVGSPLMIPESDIVAFEHRRDAGLQKR